MPLQPDCATANRLLNLPYETKSRAEPGRDSAAHVRNPTLVESTPLSPSFVSPLGKTKGAGSELLGESGNRELRRKRSFQDTVLKDEEKLAEGSRGYHSRGGFTRKAAGQSLLKAGDVTSPRGPEHAAATAAQSLKVWGSKTL
ncbi:hypothetical protein H920_06014 [Fukomys damarensis]|uniref:Uncharacterized protein n=1 Tax=Fukomys damarensis TaxID=885580 RepID=A0A091DQ44_FUKDA|nr:hypothetical protein H920_06014 [Fukomys damarensis]